MNNLSRTLLFAVFPTVLSAQVVPGPESAALVVSATDRFIVHLQAEDFSAEHDMLTTSMQQQVPLDQWRTQRERVSALAGEMVQVTPHQLTYYSQDALLAAVDYAARGSEPDVYVCGYMLWQITDAETIGLSRFEQNVVEAPLMRQMDVAQAAQLMTNWHCPASLIEGMLQIKLQN